MQQKSVRDRMEAMWLDYEEYGGPGDPTKGQPLAEGRWMLAFCLIQHFGRLPWLAATEMRTAGGPGWDPCLPKPGTPDYDVIRSVVLKAEEIIEQMPPAERLTGFRHGRRGSGEMNACWSAPLDVIDLSEGVSVRVSSPSSRRRPLQCRKTT